MIAAGRFREDLFYRLAEIVVRIPSLAARHGDATLLAHHFLAKFARVHGRTFKGFTPAALAALNDWHWPGNVRELGNKMKRAVIMAENPLLDAADLDLGDHDPAALTLKAIREGRRPARRPPRARPDRGQCLDRRQAARRQPPDAVRFAEAIWDRGVNALRSPDPSPRARLGRSVAQPGSALRWG